MLLIRSYQLLVSGYSGTAGDAMGYNSGHKFSAQDRDNDNKGGSCATERKGPWWFSNCSFSQLKQQVLQQSTCWRPWWSHLVYYWKNTWYSMKTTSQHETINFFQLILDKNTVECLSMIILLLFVFCDVLNYIHSCD